VHDVHAYIVTVALAALAPADLVVCHMRQVAGVENVYTPDGCYGPTV
jgi:hypothetical protein